MATLETISSIDTAARHPIRLVANRTGLTVDLIRAWEKRYHVVDPARSDTKRRLYSDYDIERLRLIRIAKQNGRRLVDVAPLTLEALRDVVSEDSRYDQHKTIRPKSIVPVGRVPLSHRIPKTISTPCCLQSKPWTNIGSTSFCKRDW